METSVYALNLSTPIRLAYRVLKDAAGHPYPAQSAFVPQPVAQMPWGHTRLIVSKIKDYDEALWYALATG
ncbi:MAG: hypothetical protein A2X96_08240 [Syntrophobacterales bacterium GWC2_56_13]|nr:MAG: hypothetical protein A2X96_08240 [Syntrophobacterales bacterium GWC2_56_13]